jgi:ABC-type sugar transport system permease subunit
MVPGLQMYQAAFSNNELGYGMAIGTLLFIAMLAVSFGILKLLRPRS